MSIIDKEVIQRLMKKAEAAIRIKREDRVAIIAGNYQQFKHWRENEYNPRTEAFYVASLDQLRGLDPTTKFLFVGTWTERPDADTMLEYVRYLESRRK